MSVPQAAADQARQSGHKPPLRIAVLGGGTVGGEVVRLLTEQSGELASRVGRPLELIGVGVRDLGKPRPGVNPSLLTTDLPRLIAAGPDLVIELIGGIEPARSLILAAMRAGASVISANKALLATHGAQLHEAAAANGVDLYYEAAVAGAIPLLRPLRESLAGDRIRRVLGIVNGTTNYILTQMDEHGTDFDEALAGAQRLGYAEADPTADVAGLDAAAKAAILAGLAFHSRVTLGEVSVEGITAITSADIAAARELGYVIKLLAIAELLTAPEPGVSVRVHPAMVPRTHPLASVRDAFNAVFVEADAADQVMFYGRGAGGAPTASAVLGDVVTAARNRVAGAVGPGESSYAALPVLPAGAARTAYCISLEVRDEPGVLAAVAGVFAERGVSIDSVRQHRHTGDAAALLVLTHEAREEALAATVATLRQHATVRAVRGVTRVLGQ
ncbi:MAG: homoserine dehydrogenase [Candidatus Nanopelagicales bacterium]